jgi:hypothetical protein
MVILKERKAETSHLAQQVERSVHREAMSALVLVVLGPVASTEDVFEHCIIDYVLLWGVITVGFDVRFLAFVTHKQTNKQNKLRGP